MCIISTRSKTHLTTSQTFLQEYRKVAHFKVKLAIGYCINFNALHAGCIKKVELLKFKLTITYSINLINYQINTIR